MPIQYSSSALAYTHEADFRQERNFGQKVSATFEFIGVHWRPLGRVLLYLVAPLALLLGIFTALLQSRLLSTLGRLTRQQAQVGRPNPLVVQRAMLNLTVQNPLYYFNIVLGVVFVAVCILTVYGYLLRCLRPVGTVAAPITPAEVWRVVRGHLVGTFFSLWGIALLLMLGFFVFVFPGLYLGVGLSLFFIVRLVEGTGFFGTLSRCLYLTRGKWWSTFGMIFTMFALLYTLLFGLRIVLNLALTGLHRAFSAAGQPWQGGTVFAILVGLLFAAAFFLLYPPLLLGLAFQYFNLVERREAVGLRQLVAQLGQAPLASPTGTTSHPPEEGEY